MVLNDWHDLLDLGRVSTASGRDHREMPRRDQVLISRTFRIEVAFKRTTETARHRDDNVSVYSL